MDTFLPGVSEDGSELKRTRVVKFYELTVRSMRAKDRAGSVVVLGVLLLFLLSLFRSEGPTQHDELLQRVSIGKRQQRQQQMLAGAAHGAGEPYAPGAQAEPDCLHVKCKSGAELKRKWGADGEPLDGKRENVGDQWGSYGALGKGWKGVDNHVAPAMAPCLGKACKQLHGEKWGADGEPLDGHVRENIGDQWGSYGALGKGWKGVDNHVAPAMAPCLGKACKQLHGEKWGADGEPLDGHVRENIGDHWGSYGALGKGWAARDEHRSSESPFACIGKACKLKKLSRAGSTNVGDHYSNYGALGKPYKGIGKFVDRSDRAAPCLGGRASACNDAR